MRFILLPGSLSSSCRFYTPLNFRIKPSIIPGTIIPIFRLIFQIIIKKVISTYFFPVFPFSFILSAIRVFYYPFSVKLPLYKLSLINYSIRIGKFTFSVIPPILVITFVLTSRI
mmetsp:Transcript_1944/g.278  ORF Transcript_1944/g.278 Transcript_1944/m.278 type:complete len:114 (+) Transcript_1944:259-600(+)